MDNALHVIVNGDGTLVRSRSRGKETYHGLAAARAALTRMRNKGEISADRNARVIPRSEYLANRPMVKVRNLLSGREVMIPEDEVGGPCDPSTNRYHEM